MRCESFPPALRDLHIFLTSHFANGRDFPEFYDLFANLCIIYMTLTARHDQKFNHQNYFSTLEVAERVGKQTGRIEYTRENEEKSGSISWRKGKTNTTKALHASFYRFSRVSSSHVRLEAGASTCSRLFAFLLFLSNGGCVSMEGFPLC